MNETSDADSPFPDPRQAPADRPLAHGGNLSADLLLHAYERGIFPWYAPGEPILWWSPDPRCVLRPECLKVSASLQKQMRREGWSVSVDSDFVAVIERCAMVPRQGQGGTWLTPEMIKAYCRLHELGAAHSVEVRWHGELVGGLYGLALGRIFFGESMFHTRTDASKIALVTLVRLLCERNFTLIDCQQVTPHLLSLGAEVWPRARFLNELEKALHADGAAADAASDT